MVLLRHLLGDALRRLRLRQGRTLREVSASARVSLGYLSEVERGQKEASSELLAAICSALNTPLSQVLREVSDNFALAELQVEPVFADVIEPAIAVGAVADPAGQDGAPAQTAPVGPVASVASRLPAATGAKVGAAGQLAAARLSGGHIGPGQPRPGQTITVSASLPLGPSALSVGESAFDQVSRAVREITTMVPV